MGSPHDSGLPHRESCGVLRHRGERRLGALFRSRFLPSLPPSSINLLPRHQNAYVAVQLIDLDSTVESALGLPWWDWEGWGAEKLIAINGVISERFELPWYFIQKPPRPAESNNDPGTWRVVSASLLIWFAFLVVYVNYINCSAMAGVVIKGCVGL